MNNKITLTDPNGTKTELMLFAILKVQMTIILI